MPAIPWSSSSTTSTSSRLPTGSSTWDPGAAMAAGASSRRALPRPSRRTRQAIPAAISRKPLQRRPGARGPRGRSHRPIDRIERSYYFMAVEKPTKGEQTRAAILDEALKIASRLGLEGLTIGSLADATGMSKSGLFAHFGSREDLQLAVLEHAAQRYGEMVFVPVLKIERGLPRLRALFERWLDW